MPDLLGAADTLWGQQAWQGDPQADPTACPCLPSAAYGLIVRPNDFASYLLAIGICNLLLYFAFYIIMKVGAEPWAPTGPAGRAGQGWALLPAPPHTVTPASPAAPQWRAHQAHPPALHHQHLRGLGLRPFLLLPGPKHLAGEQEGGTGSGVGRVAMGRHGDTGPVPGRKHQLNPGSTTVTASCSTSLTTTTSGISSPPSPCSAPSW